MLEEFSDSLKSLNWENVYAKKIEFMPAPDVQEIVDREECDSDESIDAES